MTKWLVILFVMFGYVNQAKGRSDVFFPTKNGYKDFLWGESDSSVFLKCNKCQLSSQSGRLIKATKFYGMPAVRAIDFSNGKLDDVSFYFRVRDEAEVNWYKYVKDFSDLFWFFNTLYRSNLAYIEATDKVGKRKKISSFNTAYFLFARNMINKIDALWLTRHNTIKLQLNRYNSKRANFVLTYYKRDLEQERQMAIKEMAKDKAASANNISANTKASPPHKKNQIPGMILLL